jgi:hypothetical protein
MKRWTAALAAATLISATAIAGTLAQVGTSDSARQPGSHRSHDEARAEEAASDYVPSVNFALDGQAAFVLP